MERPTFSEMLVNRRRELGFSIGQASRVLRLKEDVLIAFEEGNFDEMPKSGYAQGMISSYARYLGLDAATVVRAYNEDLKASRHGSAYYGTRANDRPGAVSRTERMPVPSQQPFVGQRGLLPTSGGLAGDMGSFSTTRVRSRASAYAESDYDDYDSRQDVRHTGQNRPYTSRDAAYAQTRRSYGSRAYSDIETMRLVDYDYDDDLAPMRGRSARQYESASSGSGRRSSRNISNSERPRVRRQSGGDARRSSRSGRASSRGGRQQGRSQGLLGNGRSVVALAIVAAIVLISVVLILSVTSCVNSNTNARTVPVSSAASTSSSSDSVQNSATSTSATSAVSSAATESSSAPASSAAGAAPTSSATSEGNGTSSASTTASTETSVSVSVADGAVSWLEVACDGKSDVAATITGPWQRTYTVTESITIQAGDTTAVSVIQNGRQVQFDSVASGIGSIRIQGTRTSSSTSAKDSSSQSSGSGSGTSARMGNASSSSAEESSQTEEADEEQYADNSEEQYY